MLGAGNTDDDCKCGVRIFARIQFVLTMRMIEQLHPPHALFMHVAVANTGEGEEETNVDKQMILQRRPEGALPHTIAMGYMTSPYQCMLYVSFVHRADILSIYINISHQQ